ncbi:MAG: hypothetical protein GY789_16145 [Hyphomicrobiales bacterium]|nr:hypothetical protein [Hyphomicrobiales bacterium]MCP5002106.1 hypothetical protein [Hyphomicrobiales bacterium]
MASWDEETYDHIIRQIYEAANNPEVWNQTINEIGDRLDFGAIHLMLVSYESGFEYLGAAPREDSGFNAEYLRDYALEDFRRVRIFSRPSGVAFDERMIVSEEERQNSAIHQELFPKHKIYNIMGSNMSIGDCQGWFGVTTKNESEDFTDEQRSGFQRLLPHILQSMRITKSNLDLQISRNLAFEAVDEINSGIFLFLNGQLANMNRAGREFIKEGFFTIKDGNLACRQTLINSRLQTYLEGTDQVMEGPLIVLDSRQHAEYCIRTHDPAPNFSMGKVKQSAGRLISITKLRGFKSPTLGEVESFALCYGLSEAEIQVLHAVLSYNGLKELSAARGVNLDTVRKQLKSAMAKMDVSSQKELFQMFERYRILGS